MNDKSLILTTAGINDNKISATTIVNNKYGNVSLSQVNNAIIEFIVEDPQPFSRAESKAFRNLVSGRFFLEYDLNSM